GGREPRAVAQAEQVLHRRLGIGEAHLGELPLGRFARLQILQQRHRLLVGVAADLRASLEEELLEGAAHGLAMTAEVGAKAAQLRRRILFGRTLETGAQVVTEASGEQTLLTGIGGDELRLPLVNDLQLVL